MWSWVLPNTTGSRTGSTTFVKPGTKLDRPARFLAGTVRSEHPANPFYVDPAHFLLVYGELRNDELLFGRVVGWDQPKFSDELHNPVVRLCRDDGSLEPEPLYVGSIHDPEHCWIGRSEGEIRQWVAEWRVRMAELAEKRASRPSRTMAEVLPVWEQVIDAAGRSIGPHVSAIGRQAILTGVQHDIVVVTMPTSSHAKCQRFTLRQACPETRHASHMRHITGHMRHIACVAELPSMGSGHLPRRGCG
jgi:hypothetical protein